MGRKMDWETPMKQSETVEKPSGKAEGNYFNSWAQAFVQCPVLDSNGNLFMQTCEVELVEDTLRHARSAGSLRCSLFHFIQQTNEMSSFFGAHLLISCKVTASETRLGHIDSYKQRNQLFCR